MNIPVTYQEALDKHPEAVQNALEQLRKSRSKYRFESPENLSWFYSIFVEIKGMTFSEVVSSLGKPRPQLSPEEELNDLLKRTHCCLICIPNKSSISYGQTNVPPPQSYVERNRQTFIENHQERLRFESLPKQQQDAEVQSLLKQLSGNKGFMKIKIR